MRSIHKVHMDKVRPALILTREVATPFLSGITVAPITNRIHGIATEVRVGPANGLDRESVVHCDTIVTVAPEAIGDFIGVLTETDEPLLLAAIIAAFDLRSR